jgi:hypothetical protein
MPRFFRFAFCGVLLLSPLAVYAAQPCTTTVGRLVSFEGQVAVQSKVHPPGNPLCWINPFVRAIPCVPASAAAPRWRSSTSRCCVSIKYRHAAGQHQQVPRNVPPSVCEGAFQSFSRKPHGFEVNAVPERFHRRHRICLPGRGGRIDPHSVRGTVLAANEQGSASLSVANRLPRKPGGHRNRAPWCVARCRTVVIYYRR